MQNNNKVTAIVIDDEQKALQVMAYLLENYCPNVQLLALESSSVDAINTIKTLKPNIVFLDIEMPKLNGFQLLEQVTEVDFNLIFTTAYNEFAVKAFRYSAIDYLLKPIDFNELIIAVSKAEAQNFNRNERIENLENNFNYNGKKIETIALPHSKGYIFQPIVEIISCEASNTYTTFHFKNKPSILISKPIGEIENILSGSIFFRIHKKYLVNINEIKELIKSDGGYVIMSNNQEIPISRNLKFDLMKILGLRSN